MIGADRRLSLITIARSKRAAGILKNMWQIIKFVWNATRGHHLAPWRAPYLRWRMETYTGIRARDLDFFTMMMICWRMRVRLFYFMLWTAKMKGYSGKHPKNY
jgi:hypothetical protein